VICVLFNLCLFDQFSDAERKTYSEIHSKNAQLGYQELSTLARTCQFDLIICSVRARASVCN
jgi:hypothetical protein